jgi:hypothetical protein
MKFLGKFGALIWGGTFLFLSFFHFRNEAVSLWNELLEWAVGIGQLGSGFIIPQVLFLAVVAALVFGSVVAFVYEGLSFLLD